MRSQEGESAQSRLSIVSSDVPLTGAAHKDLVSISVPELHYQITDAVVVEIVDDKRCYGLGIVERHGRLAVKSGLPRDKRIHDYCSKICCAYGLKHALILQDQGINVTVCYMDLRLEGQIWNYYQQAKQKGVSFIRGQLASIERDPTTRKLHVQVEDTLKSQVLDFEEDLVILTPALIPAEKTKWLAQQLELSIDKNGFFDQDSFSSTQIETEVPGVFVMGGAQAPMGLAQVSVQVNAAVFKILEYLGGK